MTGRLHPADVEAIVAGVAECLEPRLAALEARVNGLGGSEAAPPLVDAAEIARRFGVRREWAYEHADELGAVRLGAGPKARIRFDPARVAGALEQQRRPPEDTSATPIRRRRRQAPADGRDLLPILGEAV